ncbi:MAG: hypothetical protein P4L50_29500 [Anaerolineaceae bacterium]|nr:hypothetical protein [Anaerolineaceae bacterium]
MQRSINLAKFHNRIWISFLLLVFLLTVLNSIVLASADVRRENESLKISGALLELSARPGQVYIHNMLVSSDDQTSSMNITVEACGFGQDLAGSFVPLSAQQDTSPYSARNFITNIDHPSFSLAPGSSEPVAVTFKIPLNIGMDTYYAIIYIHSQASDAGGMVDQNTAIIVPVVITPVGAEIKPAGRIKELYVGAKVAGKPIEVLVKVRNTGNCYFKIQGEVTLSGSSGNVLADMPIPLTDTSVLPFFSRQFLLFYTPPDGADHLGPGKYTLEAKITLPDGTLLDDEKHIFVVSSPVTPHPANEKTATPTSIVYPISYFTSVPVDNTSSTSTSPAIQTITPMPALGQIAETLVSAPIATLANNQLVASMTGSKSTGSHPALPPNWQIALTLLGLMVLTLILWLVIERIPQESSSESKEL